jgi:hypothetical protein
VGYLAYVKLTSRETSGPAQTNIAQATPLPSTEVKVTEPIVNPSPSKPARRVNSSNRSTAAKVPSSPSDEDVADAVRSGSVVPNLTLGEVKKVYIEIRGDTALRNDLVASLNSSGVILVATNADEADAALKITVSQTSTSAQLVNARGTVLWPKAGRARHYSGNTSKVVSEIVKDLLAEIRY